MLLQRQDDKYLLKFHTSTIGTGGVGPNPDKSGKLCHSPIIKFSSMLVRPVATDRRAFYLLNTTQNGPQIYELKASSNADRSQVTTVGVGAAARGKRREGKEASSSVKRGSL